MYIRLDCGGLKINLLLSINFNYCNCYLPGLEKGCNFIMGAPFRLPLFKLYTLKWIIVGSYDGAH